MVTIEQAVEKPKIYTESDRILEALREELSDINDRVEQLETEREINLGLINQITIQNQIANEAIQHQQEEKEVSQSNFKIIASRVRALKSPVSDVVDNLGGIITEIDDEETQESLRECMITAEKVLDSFNEVEDFCDHAGSSLRPTNQLIKPKEFFKTTVSAIQAESKHTGQDKFRLLINRNVPSKCLFNKELVTNAIRKLSSELQKNLDQSLIKCVVSITGSGHKYGTDVSDLVIRLENEQACRLEWTGNWLDFIQENQENLDQSGLSLLKIRDNIRSMGGRIEVVSYDKGVAGFELFIPLVC